MATNPSVQPALLFMPDISGFTEFVSSTEILHAQNIIQEVLELLIESNQIGLEVGEIEGDAIFFYRMGDPPSQDQLLQQVQTMFTRFHQHLILYDHQRICPCTACSSALNLKLKIVAHYGEVSGYSVKQHHKLFGKDVIVVHRLLKNSLNKKEYTLLTLPLVNGPPPGKELPGWFCPEEATEDYDVGQISFHVSDLGRLREQLPPPDYPEVNLSAKTKKLLTEEVLIDAPAAQVFGAIFDITQRPEWMEGVKGVEIISRDLINRVGTVHRLDNGKNNPVMITEYAHISDTGAELIEMERKGTRGYRYCVEAISETATRLTIDVLVKHHPLVLVVFDLFQKSEAKKRLRKSLENLRFLCTQPVKVQPKL